MQSLRDVVLAALKTTDAIRPSRANIRVYVGGEELLQDDRSRPRVFPVGNTEKFTLLPEASADTLLHRIRIVGNSASTVAAKVTGRVGWQISWDGGTTRVNQSVVSIARNASDTAWMVTVQQGNV